jgi:pseudouridylate synthase I
MRSDWKRPALEPLEEGKRRIKLTVSYDGAGFSGWQSQMNGNGVQQYLERAVAEITGETVTIFGSGRTDSGVHALGQVCHFDTKSLIKAGSFVPALNTKLPKTVRVLDAEETDGSFHSRFTTMAREYRYFVKDESSFLPFDEKHVTKTRHLPDIKLLEEYAEVLKGTHDFTTFASARDICPSKCRDIYESEWVKTCDLYGMDVYMFRIVGNAFLYHQIRSLVGTMLLLAKKGKAQQSSDAGWRLRTGLKP